jgi:hypothetical protein
MLQKHHESVSGGFSGSLQTCAITAPTGTWRRLSFAAVIRGLQPPYSVFTAPDAAAAAAARWARIFSTQRTDQIESS